VGVFLHIHRGEYDDMCGGSPLIMLVTVESSDYYFRVGEIHRSEYYILYSRSPLSDFLKRDQLCNGYFRCRGDSQVGVLNVVLSFSPL